MQLHPRTVKIDVSLKNLFSAKYRAYASSLLASSSTKEKKRFTRRNIRFFLLHTFSSVMEAFVTRATAFPPLHVRIFAKKKLSASRNKPHRRLVSIPTLGRVFLLSEVFLPFFSATTELTLMNTKRCNDPTQTRFKDA